MKFRRIMSFAAAAAMLASVAALAPMHVSAANYAEAKYATGGKRTFNKYLVMDSNVTVPTATFNYSIAAGEEVKYTEEGATGTVAAYEGLDADKITISAADFTASTATTDGAADDGITNDTSKKYASSTFELDFTEVKFPEPGVYRYVLTETGAGETDDLGAGISHVGNYQKTLDVYVIDTDGTLSVASYVLYNSVILNAPALAADEVALDSKVDRTDANNAAKTDGFVNEYSSQDLTIGKKVTGNQGSKDKYFAFTVTFTGAAGANITIDASASNFETAPTANSATIYTAEDMAAANAKDENEGVTGQQLVIGSDSAEYTFYLQNGQYITFLGLPKGSDYEVTEAKEEYTQTPTDAENTITAGDFTLNGAQSGTINDADVRTGFINTKQGTIPTGVLLSVAAPACIGVIVLGGIIFLLVRGRKRRTEED